MPATHASTRTVSRASPLARAVAVLAFLQTAIFLVPLVVLDAAIGWPASLRLPRATRCR